VRSRLASGGRRVSGAWTPIPHPTLVISDVSEARLVDEKKKDENPMARMSSYVRLPFLLSEMRCLTRADAQNIPPTPSSSPTPMTGRGSGKF
jgi:hypothetical protein